jgi:hypothetical protein
MVTTGLSNVYANNEVYQLRSAASGNTEFRKIGFAVSDTVYCL